jgi:type IV pilus assembly protein PilW
MITQKMLSQKTKGFTLLELLVALFIGLILLGGLVQVFVATRNNIRVQTSINFMQENVRVAAADLSYRLRMAGFFHTVAKPRAQIPVVGQSLSKDVFAVTLPSVSPGCNVLSWTVGVQGFDGAAADPTSCIGADYLPNTDVVVFTYLRAEFKGLPAFDGQADTTTLEPGQVYALIFDQKFREVGTPQGGMIGNSATLSAPTINRALILSTTVNSENTFIQINGSSIPERTFKRSAALMPLEVEIYYVRKCSEGVNCTLASDGGRPQPTLMKRRLTPTGFVNEPVVDGIEQMQIEYTASGCGRPLSATELTLWAGCNGVFVETSRWQRVLNTRITLLARSNEQDGVLSDNATYELSRDTLTYSPASVESFLPNNRRYRRLMLGVSGQPRNATRPFPALTGF